MKQFACNLSFIILFFETFPRHNSVATTFLTFIPFPFFVIQLNVTQYIRSINVMGRTLLITYMNMEYKQKICWNISLSKTFYHNLPTIIYSTNVTVNHNRFYIFCNVHQVLTCMSGCFGQEDEAACQFICQWENGRENQKYLDLLSCMGQNGCLSMQPDGICLGTAE